MTRLSLVEQGKHRRDWDSATRKLFEGEVAPHSFSVSPSLCVDEASLGATFEALEVIPLPPLLLLPAQPLSHTTPSSHTAPSSHTRQHSMEVSVMLEPALQPPGTTLPTELWV